MTLLPWRDLARRATQDIALPTGVELLSLSGALGRVLSADVRTLRPLPSFDHAVMDGYALGSAPPGRYRLLPAGADRLAVGEAISSKTGEQVPEGAVAVVLAARADVTEDWLAVSSRAFKDNIRRAGEEASAGDIVLRAGVQVDARHLALAAAAGIDRLPVAAAPRIALVGVAAGAEPLPHFAIMTALLDTPRVRLSVSGAVAPHRLQSLLRRLVPTHDLIIVVGESLGDERGLLAGAILGEGGGATVFRAAMKPAKPILLGQMGTAAIVGLSGTAYAVTAAAHLVLRPVLQRAAGLSPDDPMLPAISGFRRDRSPGRAEALPVTVQRNGPDLVLAMAGRFGQLSALAALDGFALVETESGDIGPGDRLVYHPLLLPLV